MFASGQIGIGCERRWDHWYMITLNCVDIVVRTLGPATVREGTKLFIKSSEELGFMILFCIELN